jgi:hypothetical protein
LLGTDKLVSVLSFTRNCSFTKEYGSSSDVILSSTTSSTFLFFLSKFFVLLFNASIFSFACDCTSCSLSFSGSLFFTLRIVEEYGSNELYS